MPEPDTTKALAKLDRAIEMMTSGRSHLSSYEGQIIDALKEARNELSPPVIHRVTITFAVNEAEMIRDYDQYIGGSENITVHQMLAELLTHAYQRMAEKPFPMIKDITDAVD